MENIQKDRGSTQPHCHECHQALTVFASMECIIDDDSTWEGMPLRGGKRRIFLCIGHPRENYELVGYTLLGTFEWEKEAPCS